MLTPKVKHAFVQNLTKPKVMIPKTLLTFFLVIQLCYGISFGFVEIVKKDFQTLFKVITSGMRLLMFFVLISNFVFDSEDTMTFWYYLLDIIEYSTFIVFSFFCKYTVFDFLIEIHGINKNASNNYIGITCCCYVFASFCTKAILCITYCMVIKESCYITFLPEYISCIPSMTLDVLPVTSIIILYDVYACVSHLRSSLEKCLDVELGKTQYMAIADCLDRIKPCYSVLLLLQLIADVPKLMIMLWYALQYFQEESGWLSISSQCVFLVHTVAQVCTPSVVGEMIDSEMEAIKLLLHKHLMMKPGTSEEDILRLLRFMKARPLQHGVLRLFPVDLRLPVSLLNLCATYMIVVIQFTHIYDKKI